MGPFDLSVIYCKLCSHKPTKGKNLQPSSNQLQWLGFISENFPGTYFYNNRHQHQYIPNLSSILSIHFYPNQKVYMVNGLN